MRVTFQYYAESEDGCDDYRFGSEDKAMDKFCELSEIIRDQFSHSPEAEVVDEPDFFGIIDHSTGEWAKVFITNI